MKTYGGVNVYIHIFLTSALVVGEWSASRPCRFTPGERAPGTHFMRLGGPQSRSGRYGEVKIFYPSGTQTPAPPVVQPVASRYTNWAIPAPLYKPGGLFFRVKLFSSFVLSSRPNISGTWSK
jgi:hypothetical protein